MLLEGKQEGQMLTFFTSMFIITVHLSLFDIDVIKSFHFGSADFFTAVTASKIKVVNMSDVSSGCKIKE